MKKVLILVLFFLAGCTTSGGEDILNNKAQIEEVLVFCAQCADNDVSTIDLCKKQGEELVSCEFLPRCGNFAFSGGNCEIPSVCGNGVCEEGEENIEVSSGVFSLCPDCARVETCANNGFTGESVAPRNLFVWDFESIKVDTCDPNNSLHSNCDAAQALISLFEKLESTKNFIEENGVPQESTTLLGVGTLTQVNGGVELVFDFAMLSDNLSSKELLKDFEKELDSGPLSRFKTPSWMDDWRGYLTGDPSTGTGLVVEYFDVLQKHRLNENLFPAGVYLVKSQIEFVDGQGNFFSSTENGLSPNALITVTLEKKSELSDLFVLDFAFDEKIGLENPNRDYGVRWPVNSPPIVFENRFASETLDSSIYLYGANELIGINPILSQVTKEPAYFNPPVGIGRSIARTDVFFSNPPVILQTIKEHGFAQPEGEVGLGEIVEGQQTFAVFNPTTPVPLAAFVSPESTMVLGTSNVPVSYALPEPWVKVAELGESCAGFSEENFLPQIDSLCADADESIYEETFGEPFELSSQEILQNYPAGLVIHNSSNMPRLYANISFIPAGNYLQVPTIQMCNSFGELSTKDSLASSTSNIIVLENENKTLASLNDLLDKVKSGEVCVFKQSFENEPVYEDGLVASTVVEKLSFSWNIDKLLSDIYPRLYGYQANPSFGFFQYCS